MANATVISDEKTWSSLMMAAQTGDKGKYDELLTLLIPAVEKFVNARIGFYSQTNDIVQECLIAFHNARMSYDPSRPFRAWFYAVIRYRMISCLRKLAPDSLNSQLPEDLSGGDSSATILEANESAVILRRAIDKLPGKYSEAIKLTKLEENSTAEAASLLGISESALKVRAHRGMKLLKKSLEGMLSEI